MIFVRYPFPSGLKTLDFGTTSINVGKIVDDIGFYLGCNQFSLFYNGKRLHDEDVVPDNSTVHVTFSLPGGKGGFGSMLRAIGAQIEKTTNREACRDLSGRRLRDINEEQRLKKWIAKEAEREAEKVRRRQARIERLKTKIPHQFFDYEYEKKISELPERIDDALSEGLQKVKDSKKRPHENPKETKLPKKSWLIDDLPSSSSGSESDDANAESEHSSKKIKMTPKQGLGCGSNISESLMSYPGSSKDSCFIPEESTSSDSKSFTKEDKYAENSTDSGEMDAIHVNVSSYANKFFNEEKYAENSTDSGEMDAVHENVSSDLKSFFNEERYAENSTDSGEIPVHENDLNETKNTFIYAMHKSNKKKAVPETSSSTISMESNEEDEEVPTDLMEFENISQLEALGLYGLKIALMRRGLKCGGTLSVRVNRLWKVRGLHPDQYPVKLLAKNKK